MKLVIVESPSKSKTIKKYLGKDYEVKSSVGHVRDLPKSNRLAINIEKGFVPYYEILEDKKKIISDLKKSASKASEVLLATDPDREGEAIAWHLKEALELKNPKRIVFNEITKPAIAEAMKHPRKIDLDLKSAQEARRVLDRLFGYDLSGLIWKKVRYGLSAGRVQSPALRIIVEREKEISNFKPEKFWTIVADLKNSDKKEFSATCFDEPRDKKIVAEIIEAGKKNYWKVKDIQQKELQRMPYPPFITSTLQQAASSRLGLAPSKTMFLAQRLYEAGLITYMRTDSPTLSNVAMKQIAGVVSKKFGKENLKPRVFRSKRKSAQEAHEGIRPTDMRKEIAGSNEEQKKLYELIWQRTVASQMVEANTLSLKLIVGIETDKKIPDFFTRGFRVLVPGWLLADPSAKKENIELPKVKKGDKLELIRIESLEKETLPPPRYTEAGLIKELEKRGIGRPSTYATIIKTLRDRNYTAKEGRALKPTDTGEIVSDFLNENFNKYISDSFTAKMENELDEIAEGKRKYVEILKEFYAPFDKDVRSKEKMEKITNLGKADSKFKCPECKGSMIIKLGKTGKFLSCEKFPDCQGARTIDGKKLEGPKETGEKCPQCEDGKLVTREGRFGKFISCSNFPKCKYIKEDPKEAAKKNTGVKCPKCVDGEMTEKRGRFGTFYACSNYPDCKYAINAKPTGKKCPTCGSLMMQGTKTIPERCSDKNCPNNRPDKLEKK
ncbi:MAG: type I DNA topoisomerase [Candidatus Moranbacteria bacterium]|jgi:DNA topoisomerase-1|nr:type I DNA topoisomerase [Candidatus Moranbacteria bacterium]MDD5651850.1 type I DNA topoisomerase [Candidatus Moranbacteria bacterium]MDX9855338.1 type I DNA topoisomerase [Candidatus Moranbacteria bacterium]